MVYNPITLGSEINSVLGGVPTTFTVKIINLNPPRIPNYNWDMNFYAFTPDQLVHVWQLFHNS
jgi:hypothetical protein